MQTAVDGNHAAWPQQNSNWCGVADLAAINNYDWQKYSGSMNPTYKTQSSVANHLQSNAAISPWGVAVPHPGQGSAFKANIAADYGTDPRAMTWGIYDITPPGYWFHNYNYSQNDNSTANSATYQVALDYGPAHGMNAPVIVVIWGGRHALIQDGGPIPMARTQKRLPSSRLRQVWVIWRSQPLLRSMSFVVLEGVMNLP